MRLKYGFVGLVIVACMSAVCFSADAAMTIDQEIMAAHGDAAFRSELESRSVAAIKGGGSWREKDRACRILRVIGTKDSVGALAGLLQNEQLSHMARYALEGMTYPEADKALRGAVAKTSGATKAGVIQSIGVRRDRAATGMLSDLLKSSDTDVAGAAAWALGRMGTAEAAKALLGFSKTAPSELKGVVFDALLTVSDDLAKDGKSAQAVKIYAHLQTGAKSDHVRMSAFAGLLAAQPDKAVDSVLEAMSDESAAMRNFAIAQIATLEGAKVSGRFAAQLPKLEGDQQVLLIEALVQRKDTTVRGAITSVATSSNIDVRTAGAKALGDIGTASSVKVLTGLVAKGAGNSDGQAAAASLRRLKAEGVNEAIMREMNGSDSAVRVELIKVLNDRSASDAVRAILKAAQDRDDDVRVAALRALGNLAGPERLGALVELLVDLEGDAVRKEAERAVISVSLKIQAEGGRSRAAMKAFASAKNAATKCSLLRVLAGIGEASSFDAVAAAVTDSDPVVKDAAIRAMASWPDPAAVKHLVGLYSTTENELHRTIVLRGCVRLLGMGKLTDGEMIRACRTLMKGAGKAQEKKLVLAVLAKVGDVRAVKMVEPLLEDNEVRAEAELAMLGIARAMAGSKPAEARATASKLIKKSKNDTIVKQARALIREIDGGKKK